MSWLKTRILSVLFAAAATSLVLAGDTGMPYPAGTSVEITTPAGTVSGVLEDRTTPGWVMLREADRALPTAVPEKSIAFIRAQAPPPPPPVLPPDVEKKEAPSDHYVFGRPRVTKPERFAFQPAPGGPLVEGVTILKKHAFTLGHYDKHKTPAWVAMRWTKEHLDISEKESSHPRNFQADTELPPYARTGKDYQHSEFGYERGHMARHEDLSGFPAPGDPRRGTREGCLMSNIVPQQRCRAARPTATSCSATLLCSASWTPSRPSGGPRSRRSSTSARTYTSLPGDLRDMRIFLHFA